MPFDVVMNIYSYFNFLDTVYVEGEYPITIRGTTYKLNSYSCHLLKRWTFESLDLTELFDSYKSELSSCASFVKGPGSFSVSEADYDPIISKSERFEKKMNQKVAAITDYCTRVGIAIPVKIEKNSEDESTIEAIGRVYTREKIQKQKILFLAALREFQSYHELTRAPHIYQNNIHFRDTEGIFAFFSWPDGNIITEPASIHSWWTPKFDDNAQQSALAHFNAGHKIEVKDLLMARSLIYNEQFNYSLAIIHAVMSLEVIVPNFINSYFASKGVGQKAITDFNSKFGLSVRVKALLKIILPKEHHQTIDTVGELIATRNKIIHDGLDDIGLIDMNVDGLIKAALKLKGVIENGIGIESSNEVNSTVAS